VSGIPPTFSAGSKQRNSRLRRLPLPSTQAQRPPTQTPGRRRIT
jgi:hypothetical protein